MGTQVGGSFIWDRPSLGVSGLPDVGLEASGRAVGGGVSLRPWWAVSTASRRAPLHVLVPGRSRCTCQQVRRSVSGPGFFPVFARTAGPWAHWTLVQKQGGHNLEQKEEVRNSHMWGMDVLAPPPTPASPPELAQSLERQIELLPAPLLGTEQGRATVSTKASLTPTPSRIL